MSPNYLEANLKDLSPNDFAIEVALFSGKLFNLDSELSELDDLNLSYPALLNLTRVVESGTERGTYGNREADLMNIGVVSVSLALTSTQISEGLRQELSTVDLNDLSHAMMITLFHRGILPTNRNLNLTKKLADEYTALATGVQTLETHCEIIGLNGFVKNLITNGGLSTLLALRRYVESDR